MEQEMRQSTEAAIVESIRSIFGVTEEQVRGLRRTQRGYYEIVIILSIARALAGTVTPESIDHIVALRRDSPAIRWASLARGLGLDLDEALRGGVWRRPYLELSAHASAT
jgi:hypothetical protein